ncbi:MAG TPA: sulfatase-like hydrolase/transferase [Orrella sp.]
MKNNQHVLGDRRDFLKASGALATSAIVASPSVSKASPDSSTSISGGSQSKFPSAQAPGSRDGGYNIVFILTDQEQYMGDGWPIPLPGHERLKRDGMYFENHHISADMCSASRAVIYTGLHMPHNGIFDNAGVPYMQSLNAKLPTIGKALRKIGYYPAYKGKFHLNTAMAIENHPSDIKTLFESLMDENYGFYDYTGVGDFIEGPLGGYQYDQITSAQAIQWLKSKGQSMASEKQPWFLAVNLVNPHDVMWVDTDKPGDDAQRKQAMLPIAPVPKDKNYTQEWNDIALPQTWQQPLDAPGRIPAHRIYHDANAVLTGMIPNDERPVRVRQNFYFNSIRAADEQISAVLDALDDLGLTENTIVIFTADHGELLSSHGGLTGKGTTAYKEQNHVPMIVMHPAYPGGRSCKELTCHLDILPTVVGMTQKNVEPIKDMMALMKGRDISGLLAKPDSPAFSADREAVLFCYSQLMVHDPAFTKLLYTVVDDKSVSRLDQFKKIEDFPIDWSLRVAIRSIFDGRYKFSRYFSFRNFNTPQTMQELLSNNDIELYDTWQDPNETDNLAARFDQHRDLIDQMNQKMNRVIGREIGRDDGSFLPLKNWINWDGVQPTHLNI